MHKRFKGTMLLIVLVGLLAGIGAGGQGVAAAPAPQAITLLQFDGKVVLLNGKERRTVAFMFDQATWPAMRWSPDGHRLALGDGVYTFGAGGTAPAIAPLLGEAHEWRPDGKQLVQRMEIGLSDGPRRFAIVLSGPDGDGAKVITTVDEGGDAGGTEEVGLRPHWTPDGRSVVIGRKQVAVGAAVPVAERIRDPNGVVGPNGKQWARLVAYEEGDGVRVRLEVTDGKRATPITVLPWKIKGPEEGPDLVPYLTRVRQGLGEPHWLPDGSLLVTTFERERMVNPKDAGTWLIRPNGTARWLSPYFVWDLSADGQRMLAELPGTSYNNNDVAVVRTADGVVERHLGPAANAVWRPALRGAAPSAPLAAKTPELSLKNPRMQGAAVREAQTLLKQLEYYSGSIDGIYGPSTQAAVRAFQDERISSGSGLVDYDTWARLRTFGLTLPYY